MMCSPQAHLMEMGSEQVAGVLRASGSRVRLVVARAADPAAPPHAHHVHQAPLVPARYVPSPQVYPMKMGSKKVMADMCLAECLDP